MKVHAPLKALAAATLLAGCGSIPDRPPAPVLDDPWLNAADRVPATQPPALPAPSLLPSLSELIPDGVDQRRFDVSADRVTASGFFVGLVETSGVNIVVPPDLEGEISLNLRNVTLVDVLAAVRDAYGFDYAQTDYGYRVRPDSLQTRVFKIDYLDVAREGVSRSRVNATGIGDRLGRNDDEQGRRDRRRAVERNDSDGGVRIETRSKAHLWEELRVGVEQILAGASGRVISVSPQAGIVVVTATPRELDTVGTYLDELEGTVNRQVTLEAKIIEVTLSDGFQSGINWSGLGRIGNHGTIGINQTGGGTLLGGSGANAGNSGSLDPRMPMLPELASAAAFGGAFSAAVSLKDFVGFIELLKTQGDVRVLSSPRVSTLNNQKAVIKVGTDQFFVTDIATTTTSAGNALQTTPNIELTPFFSGIALDVTPQVSADATVTLHVHPTISEVREVNKSLPVGDSSRDVPLAVSTVRESDSIVRARSGQVIVIGGLMQTQVEDDRAGVPGLSEIPLLGRAFRHERQRTVKKELVILLRPVVGDASPTPFDTALLGGRGRGR